MRFISEHHQGDAVSDLYIRKLSVVNDAFLATLCTVRQRAGTQYGFQLTAVGHENMQTFGFTTLKEAAVALRIEIEAAS